MTVKFTNNASTTVATGINTTATSLVVTSASGFPTLSGSGDYCYLTIQQAAGTGREVVKATALSSNTFTIVRAQDGTSAGSWSVSDVVELRVTAALLTDIVDAATHDSSVLSVDSTNNRVGVNDTTPSVTLDISGTDAIALPVGTTAQRPSGSAGRFRYNSSLSQFEGYTDAWGAIGGGGTNTFTTDTFTANGSLVAFNLSQTVSSESNLLVFIDGVFQTQDAYAIATASGTTTLTFSAAPANARKIVVYSVAAGISGSNLNIDSMTGDGSDVTLTLSIAPVTINNTIVTIDGVYQAKANYSISGTTLTFSTAPPTGSAVEVMTFTQTDINVPVDGTITSAKLSGALTTPSDLTVTGALTVDTNTLVVDATNNRMGVGTSSPASLIDATGAPLATSGSIVRVRNTSATSSNTSFGGVLFTSSPGTDFSIGKSNVNAATSLSFRNGNTGASLMELTSAGDLLVGKSAIDFATVGTEIMDHGEIQVTRAGVPMYLRRNGSDGDILSLYRDGTTVGSIGTNSGYMVIGSPVGTDAHLLIGNNLIHPATSSGGVKDAAIDLGGSSNRFKDLYLSGKLHINNDIIMKQTNGRIDYDNGVSSGALRFFSVSSNTERLRISAAGGITGTMINASNGEYDGSLDDLKKTGFYRSKSSNTNNPSYAYYSVVVYGNQGNVTAQIATLLSGPATYVRSFNTVWTSWVRIDD